MQDGDTVLNFGAGKVNRDGVVPHSEVLRAMGARVTDYDFPGNQADGVHDPDALQRKYDIVMASNVMNVQQSAPMIAATLGSISRVLKPGGFAVFNYPKTPRKAAGSGKDGKLTGREFTDIVSKHFDNVERIQGSRDIPMLKVSH